jgi:hypothetical protein
MTPEKISKLLGELRELAALDDPAFSARTQSKRVCRQAAEAIEGLLDDVRRLKQQIKALVRGEGGRS